MKKRYWYILSAVLGLALIPLVASAVAPNVYDSVYGGRIVVKETLNSAQPVCTIATGKGSICAADHIEALGNVQIAGNLTVSGSLPSAISGTYTGAQNDTITDAVAGVFVFTEAAGTTENLKLTATSDLWTWSSTTSATMAITPALAVAGVTTASGGLVTPATRTTASTATLTTAGSGGLYVAANASDATTTYTLPAASTKAKYCFAADSVSGSSRAIKIEPPAGADIIVGTTNAAGGTGIATTAGAGYGITNTHGSAVRGNFVCLQADGTATWYMTSVGGTWAAY